MIKKSLLLLLLFAGFLFAQSVDECMDCHSDEEMTKTVNDSIELSLYVDLALYQKSIHGDMECVDCHSTIEDVDHEEDLPDVDCAQCHEDSEEEYSESIHAQAITHDEALFTGCKDCHGTHNIFSSDDSLSTTYPLNIENTCGRCHSKPEVIKLLGLRGEGPAIAYHNSIHNQILREQPEKGAPTCINCHGYHEVFLMSDYRSSFNKLNRAETCGNCHEAEK